MEGWQGDSILSFTACTQEAAQHLEVLLTVQDGSVHLPQFLQLYTCHQVSHDCHLGCRRQTAKSG